MSKIRVTYSGLISFAVGLASVFTGIIFILIVTRQLTPEEFGTWNLIGGLIVYVVILEPTISYWVTREIARGKESGKTAVFFSGIFSIGATLAYLVIAYFVAQNTDVKESVLFLGAILIPVMFLNRTLTAVNLAWKPHAVSYGILFLEIFKIPAALMLVYYLDMGIEGAIISTTLAYIASIVILFVSSRIKLRGLIELIYLKKWIRLSWLPLYPGVASMIYVLDVTIFAIITGSVEGLAFWSAALAVAALAMHARSISNAIYPKFLEGGKKEHLQENIMLILYFSIPLAILSITFAKPALFALNPIYITAVPVVVMLTLRGFMDNMKFLFVSSIQGMETVDVNENSSFKNYLKSKLFFMPTLQLIQYGLYVGALTAILVIFNSKPQSELVLYWSIISVVISVPFVFCFYYITRKHFKFSINYLAVIKYVVISTGVFGFTFFLMEEYLVYNESIFEFLPQLLLFLAIGCGGYLVITYFTDKKTKVLFKAVFHEIRKKNTNES
ncbi:MAG: hypothetical protein WD154_05555 [Nitrosopumilaceae archaeon]